jgi:hypothetical protein
MEEENSTENNQNNESRPAEEKSKTIALRWSNDEGDFIPIDSVEGDGIFIELDEKKKTWTYSFTPGASLISRRTAYRKANGISKTGFVMPITSLRIGVACKLIEKEEGAEESVPEKLRAQQRTWYEKK